MHFRKCCVVHMASPLGKPVIDTGKNGKDCPWHQHIMEMSNHKIGVVILKVSRGNGKHQAGKTTDSKQHNKGDREQHRCFKGQRTSEHGCYPVKDFYPGWDSYQHGGIHKKHFTDQRNPHGEHMVSPNNKREEGNTCHRIDHGCISKQRFTSKGRDNRRYNTKSG